MTDDEFMVQLREAFAIEAREHLDAITAGVLELEQSSPGAAQKEGVERTFREAHSLKGAASAVNRTDVASVCQALESVFSQWKRQELVPSPQTFDVLNRALDLVTRLLREPEVSTGAAERAEISAMVRDLGNYATAPAAPAPPVREPVEKRSAPAREAAPAVPATDVPRRVPAADPVRVAPAGGSSPEAANSPAPVKANTPAAPVMPTTPPAAERAPEMPLPAEQVRIPLAKMDALLRQAEEMIAVKLMMARTAAKLRGLKGELEGWRKEWPGVRGHLPGEADEVPLPPKVAEFLSWNADFMGEMERRLTALANAAGRDERAAAMLVEGLLGETKQLVMRPCGTLLDVFPKLVRDLARTQGKEISLRLAGREVEIDKRILQEMKDPLIHLVRNAIDHGMETPSERVSAGKRPAGTLRISVTQLDGSKVEMVVSDDGHGIDAAKVRESAVQAGTISAEAAAGLDDQSALGLICHSGVSTSPMLTEISGRGLGMAIVRDKVASLGGQMRIESFLGQGTTFRITLPVTMATFKGILVVVSGQTFVIPTQKIERIVRVPRESVKTVENRETIECLGQALALAHLHRVLELPAPADPGPFLEVLVLGAAERRIGFAVDAVLREQEVLVKELGPPLKRVRNVAGATVLGSGRPALILNTDDLLNSAVRLAAGGGGGAVAPVETKEEKRARRILVADDSITSRMLLKNILESAGFAVETAVDGREALTTLKSRDFDLLVSDVEMPRMDGFELTAKVRAEAKLAGLPVVLVTALGSREHQERGIDVGASAYIVKTSFERNNLLDVIRKFL